MRTNDLTVVAPIRTIVTVVAMLGLMASTAAAQTHTVDLIAAPFNKSVTLPNGTTVAVPMWGFALDTAEDTNGNGVLDVGEDTNGNGVLDPAEPPTVPGPRISVPPGTSTLTINLKNQLPVPTSLVIPGQPFAAVPVRNAAGRIVSMTAETLAGATGSYTFTDLKPGTFLYQSGTHQAVQVQMGLYGAVTQDAVAAVAGTPATPAEAYDLVPYDSQVLLLYSEIDVALHRAVADGTYGTPPGPTSTINYNPTLFLINGESYANETVTPAIEAGAAGQSILIRLLNAGLRTHVPVLDKGTLTLVAEDGNKYPFARPQAAILLAAGKTHDATWTAPAAGVYAVYDRSLSLSAPGQGAAGMLAKLRFSAAASDPPPSPDLPVAVSDAFTTAEDTAAGGNVLTNDTGATSAELVTNTGSGLLTLLGNGVFSYQPAPDFFGVDSFTYRAVNTAGSQLATVTITVTAVADGPVALAQAVGLQPMETVPVTLSGTDADGDALTFYLTALPINGTLSIVDPVTSNLVPILPTDVPSKLRTGPGTGTPIPAGTLIYASNVTPGADPFSFVASDDSGVNASAPAAVAVTVHPLPSETESLSALALTVVGPNGAPIGGGYRWTLEEDRTYDVRPGVLDPDTLSVSFHPSYMPVRRSGDDTTLADLLVDPSKRYFVSVLPKTGPYTNGGAPVAAGQSSVTVKVNSGPMPTAQIRVRVFQDNAALNGMWDTGEVGLSGFAVTLEDAGGRYGMSAGQQLMDAFGNPIGTVYAPCPAVPPAECTSYEVVTHGKGYVLSDADGWALIQNLAPGKYGVKVVVPGGTAWQQTATIEGTRVIDAWVKANEPTFFAEFGPPGPHADLGFTLPTNTLGPLGGSHTITGQVTNLHHSRPPNFQMFSGAPFDFTRPWVALNTGAVGGTLLYAQPTDEEGNFSIAGVPSGTYQLVIFDSALNLIIANKVLNVTGTLALGEVPVQQWFARLYNYVFDDPNENGLREEGEAGIPEQAINIRWRDGSMYQSMPTDTTGFVPFEQVFPFFSWLVAEVDFTRFKATGVTAVVDAGGNPTNTTWPGQVGAELDPRVLVPQPQSENGGAAYRTETGPVLLEAFQGFLGQSSVLLWGKAPYAPAGSIVTDVNLAPFDEFPGPCASGQTAGVDCDKDANGNGAFDGDQFHGGISGIVHYSTTRAENDPRWGGAEVWEPGIADVTVQLWDVTRTQLLNEVTTDSWDASQPTGCQGEVFTFRGSPKDCYDGLRNFNQVRPGVFDGGYAFLSRIEPITVTPTANWLTPVAERDNAGFREVPLPAGKYVVRVVPPRGYKVVKEEDKNVDFGDEYIPQEFYLTGYPLGDAGASAAPPRAGAPYEPLAVPFCVGSLHEVPAELSLYPGVPGAYGGDRRPLCDQKLVTLRDGQNPGANFFLFTEAPVAGHIVGFVLDDTANEFDANSPQFGEKYAPPFMPISIRDWTGREITSTYTDAYGRYNVLVPSTFTANQPIPSGMSPNMLTACINSPTVVTAAGLTVPNPHHYKQYTHFCYTFQYMPGTTTYLDTPVLPTGAFAGTGQFPVDAELPSGTPVIAKVTNIADLTNGGAADPAAQIGPYIVDRTTAANPNSMPQTRRIDITSGGMFSVPNPAYDGLEGLSPKTIDRDYTFGPSLDRVVVRLGAQALPAANVVIPPGGSSGGLINVLRVLVPRGAETSQLTVERCLSAVAAPCTDWRKSVLGVTLTVASPAMHAARPPIVKQATQTIQQAIDAAPPGDLVLVPPGTYEEAVVMRKPVRLQGWGALSTVINTVTAPAEKLQAWREYVVGRLNGNNGTDFLLANQLDILGAPPFGTEGLAAALGGEAPGVMVLGRPLPLAPGGDGRCRQDDDTPFALNNQAYCLQREGGGGAPVRPNARIDGFSIIGAMNGAGIMVNANARHLDIGNNRITNNSGDFAGGIRVGQAGAVALLADENALNTGVTIHNNLVGQNAGIAAGGGGGIVIGTGANNYEVRDNFVAGNFTAGQGAGIAHIGRSPGGVIDRNAIVFNEGFNQGLGRQGGGLFIGGRAPGVNELTPGSGSVTVSNNLIQGNHIASGDGGGVALEGVNGGGPDVGPENRSRVRMYNNIIVNNVAGLAGGGVSLHDAAFVEIIHNTIARNDSLATAGGAFVLGAGDTSTPQPAGIVARGHSPLLPDNLGGSTYSNPLVLNSIVWQNRSFYFGPSAPGSTPTHGLRVSPGGPGRNPCAINTVGFRCWDFGVLGAAGLIDASYTVVTSVSDSPGTGNTQAAPAFVASYINGSRNPTIVIPEQTSILVPVAFDEGGTFIRPIYGPLSLQNPSGLALFGNYHVTAGVTGTNVPITPSNDRAPLLLDIDGQARPTLAASPILQTPHRGADQKTATAAPTNPLP